MKGWFRRKEKINAQHIVAKHDVKSRARGRKFGDIKASYIWSEGDVIIVSGPYIDQRVREFKVSAAFSGDTIFLGSSLKMEKLQRVVLNVMGRSPKWQVITSRYPKQHAIELLETDLVNINICDIFIGLYGENYSLSFYKPLQISAVNASTVPELELRYAQQSFKRCLCFILQGDVSEPLFLEAPDYKKPNILTLTWLQLKSWYQSSFLGEKHTAILEEGRIRYAYIRTKEIVERLNKHNEKSYRAMCHLRSLVTNRSGVSFQFTTPDNLAVQLSTALRQYNNLEITGFVPSLVKARWIEWAQQKKEKVEIRQSLLGLRKPSVLEFTTRNLHPAEVGGDGETSTNTSVWVDFINYVWHEEVEARYTNIYQLTGLLAEAQLLTSDEQQPFAKSLFNDNYEVILLNLKAWLGSLPPSEEVKKQIQDLQESTNATMHEWRKKNKKLKNEIQKANPVTLNKVELDRIQELTQEILEQISYLESVPCLEGVVQLSTPFFETFSVKDDEANLSQAKLWCEQSLEEYKKVETRLNELRKTFDKWRSAVKSLKQAVTDPHLGRCLFIIGRDGAGKSHFTARLLDEMTEYNVYPLLLDKPQIVDDWGQFLAETAYLRFDAEDIGPKWRGIDELDRYLSGQTRESIPFTPLVIILDDLENWIRLDRNIFEELKEFIGDHTQLSTLRWIITLTESAFFTVAHEEPFIIRYGFQSEYQPVKAGLPGWIILDDLNEKMRVGEQIIGRGKIEQELFEPNPAINRLIHNPFIAWTVADLDLLPELPNLNFIELIQRLWNHRLQELAKIASSHYPQDDLQPEFIRFVQFVAERFSKGEIQFWKESLHDESAEWDANLKKIGIAPSKLSNKEIAEVVINALIRKYFLVPTTYDRDQIAKQGRILQLDILPFWLYWGGSCLADEMAKKADNSEVAWQTLKTRFNAVESSLAAGMLEFSILWLDQMAVEESRTSSEARLGTLVQDLTERVIKEFDCIQSNIWLAAAKASLSYQHELGQRLMRKRHFKLERREDLHHFMFFLNNAKVVTDGGLAPHVRLKLLRSYYLKIQEFGFVPYFNRLVNYLLDDWIGGAEIARSAAYLYGVESFWDAEQQSKWIYKKLEVLATVDYKSEKYDGSDENNSWERLLDWLLILRNEVSQIRPMHQREFRKDAKPERDRLWAWIVGRFCSSIIDEMDLSCFKWVAEKEWFSWSQQSKEINSRINDAMEEQLTTALGRWYRKPNRKREEENKYIEKVEELAHGNGQQKVTAIFLIYHTVPKNSGDKLNRVELRNKLITLYEGRKREPCVEQIWRIPDLKSFYESQLE